MICKKWCPDVKSVEQDIRKITSLDNEEMKGLHNRIKELEDSIEKEYGIKVRNEITEVRCEFDKIELTVLYAGLCSIMSKAKGANDVDFYLKLRTKLETFLPDMKEED